MIIHTFNRTINYYINIFNSLSITRKILIIDLIFVVIFMFIYYSLLFLDLLISNTKLLGFIIIYIELFDKKFLELYLIKKAAFALFVNFTLQARAPLNFY